MHIRQEDFDQACEVVIAVVREHAGDDEDGIHGYLRSLGLEPTSTIDVAEEIASSSWTIDDPRVAAGYAFITGMLVGLHLSRAVEQRRDDAPS